MVPRASTLGDTGLGARAISRKAGLFRAAALALGGDASVAPPMETAELRPVALAQPAAPAPEVVLPAGAANATASDGTTRVVKFVEPKLPGAE